MANSLQALDPERAQVNLSEAFYQPWFALAKSSLDRGTGGIDIPGGSSKSMRIGRTILAFWVALSLATLPMAGAFAVPNDQTIAANDTAASEHDCCDHEGMPADRGMKACQASADCAAKCSNFYAVMFPSATVLPPTGGMESTFVSNPFHSQTASPPYRPPRV